MSPFLWPKEEALWVANAFLLLLLLALTRKVLQVHVSKHDNLFLIIAQFVSMKSLQAGRNGMTFSKAKEKML